ncbi:MAG: RNA-guided endonuclease TnpB family protein [Caldilineaceae bacterium]
MRLAVASRRFGCPWGAINTIERVIHALILKAFKSRLYPDEEQQAKLAIQFGHARFVYNAALELRKEMYFKKDLSINYADCAWFLAQAKDDPQLAWLKDADSQVLQQSLMDLDKAYKRFFDLDAKGMLPKLKKPRHDGMPGGYPSTKCKRDKQSIRYPQRFQFKRTEYNQFVYLPKVGWVQMVQHRPLKGTAKNVTVSKTKSGKYFVSVQCEIKTKRKAKPASSEVGIDLGLKDFATLSTGEKIAPPKPTQGMKRRLAIRQRRLSRKFEAKRHRHWFMDRNKGDNSIKRATLAVAVTHEKIANRRKDFHHQLSRALVNEFGLIALEDLNVKGMMQNSNLATSIADAGWAQFVQFLTYKQAWANGEIRHVDRFYPSSKTCSCCGAKNSNLKLSDRRWVCPGCGVIHDRDTNAALNIVQQATVGATESGLGNQSNALGHMSLPVGNSAPEQNQGIQRYAQLALFALEAQAL